MCNCVYRRIFLQYYVTIKDGEKKNKHRQTNQFVFQRKTQGVSNGCNDANERHHKHRK